MHRFAMEQGKAVHRHDFVMYGIAAAAFSLFLLLAGPGEQRLEIISFVLFGLAGWTALEYVLHRFVLHGLQPFRRWHAEHHHQPALIYTPTILSGGLIAALVLFPLVLLGNPWQACALALGLLSGYLVYSITHHAIHHSRVDSPWLQRRRHWHTQHHHVRQAACYGVTSTFWDHVFGSLGKQRGRGYSH